MHYYLNKRRDASEGETKQRGRKKTSIKEQQQELDEH